MFYPHLSFGWETLSSSELLPIHSIEYLSWYFLETPIRAEQLLPNHWIAKFRHHCHVRRFPKIGLPPNHPFISMGISL